MSWGETTAKCPGLWMWPVCPIWPQGPENRSWPSFDLVVQKQSEVQRNTPKCGRRFSHKLKMKGTNRTKAAPARRPAWVSGSRWAEHLADWSLLPLKKFFGWLAQVELHGLEFAQPPGKRIGAGGVPDYSQGRQARYLSFMTEVLYLVFIICTWMVLQTLPQPLELLQSIL